MGGFSILIMLGFALFWVILIIAAIVGIIVAALSGGIGQSIVAKKLRSTPGFTSAHGGLVRALRICGIISIVLSSATLVLLILIMDLPTETTAPYLTILWRALGGALIVLVGLTAAGGGMFVSAFKRLGPSTPWVQSHKVLRIGCCVLGVLLLLAAVAGLITLIVLGFFFLR